MQSLVGLLEVCLYFFVGFLLCLELLRMEELENRIQGKYKIGQGNNAHDDRGNSVRVSDLQIEDDLSQRLAEQGEI